MNALRGEGYTRGAQGLHKGRGVLLVGDGVESVVGFQKGVTMVLQWCYILVGDGIKCRIGVARRVCVVLALGHVQLVIITQLQGWRGDVTVIFQ
jgi:hypothetical protein